MILQRQMCLPFVLLTVMSVTGAPAVAADFTILVNGSFDAYPPWMDPSAPEYQDIAATMGVQPTLFRWTDNSAVIAPTYSGIYNGGYALANFINSLGLAPSDNLDVVAHSHGGNVVKIAAYFTSHPIRHLINLATPINYDLPLLGGSTAHYCQVSSFTDPVQFGGSSPFQIAVYGYDQYYAGVYATYAFWDAYYGDWNSFYYDSAQAAYYQSLAASAWLSTKIALDGAANYMFYGGQSHSDMHEPPIWDSIKSSCATN